MPSNYKFLVGAELECYIDNENAAFKRINKTHPHGGDGNLDNYELMQIHLKNKRVRSDIDVCLELSSDHPVWKITEDGSLQYLYRMTGMEIVSPPMPFTKFKRDIAKMWNILDPMVSTTNDCGYHHGISFADRDVNERFRKRLPYFMWLWQAKEKAAAARWNREHSQWCSPIEYTLEAELECNDLTLVMGPDGYLAEMLEKDVTINAFRYFEEPRYNYIELRFMGGEGYHKKYRSAIKECEGVMALMTKAVDTVRDRKFIQFLMKHSEYEAGSYDGKYAPDVKAIMESMGICE